MTNVADTTDQTQHVGIRVTAAQDSDRADWNAFVKAQPFAEIYHRYEWRSLLENVFGHQCHYLMARGPSGDVKGVLPLSHLKSRLFGSFLVSIPCFNYCGVLSDDAEIRESLVAAAASLGKRIGSGHVELRHRDHVTLDLPYREDKVSMQMVRNFTPQGLFLLKDHGLNLRQT